MPDPRDVLDLIHLRLQASEREPKIAFTAAEVRQIAAVVAAAAGGAAPALRPRPGPIASRPIPLAQVVARGDGVLIFKEA